MHLTQLTCNGFRCLRDIDFTPDPGLNIIRGLNAQGKTSLLEALLFLTTSKSHRTNLESDLVCRQEQGFQLSMSAQRRDREVTLQANYWQGTKRFKVNGVAQERISDILGKVNVVFFSPEDIALVKGGASVRRKFLDMELSQLQPRYLNALQEYRQVLRQRNELLRSKSVDEVLLDVWDEQLVRHGSVLMKERASFLNDIGAFAAESYARIADGESFSIHYKADGRSPELLAEVVRDSRASDMRRQMTKHGPHKDDIEIEIDGVPARSHASQGQQKSAALAIKLAELELVKRKVGEYPILMLDEVLSELDDHRAKQLFEAIPNEVQCLLTTTDLDDKSDLVGRRCAYFHMEAGRLTRCVEESAHG